MSIFESIEEIPGKTRQYGAPTAEQVKRYRKLLPEVFVTGWKEKGWCSYGDGLIWIVDPDEYVDVVAEWLPKERDRLVVARFSLGDMVLYSKRAGLLRLDVQYGKTVKLEGDLELYFQGTLSRSAYLRDVLDWKLHKQAVKKLGVLGPDEVYAFVPALPLGGESSIKHVQKEKLFPYLSILAQLFKKSK